MPKTKNGRRHRWTQTELDNFYRAAIIERRPKDYLLAKSGMDRTWAAINSKMWKAFRIVQRTDENGITYMYLADEVPSRIIRRRKEASVISKEKIEVAPAEKQDVRTALINQIAYFNQEIGSKEVELFEMKRVVSEWNNKLVELNKELS